MNRGVNRMSGNNNSVMNINDVSTWLRIPKSTLYKLCNEGQIPCTKIGKHWRFDRKVVESWFEEKMRKQLDEGLRGPDREPLIPRDH